MNAISSGGVRVRRGPHLLAIIFIFSISLSVFSPILSAEPFQKVISREPSEQEIDRMLSIAEAQFDIVKVLIKQGRTDQVLPEMRKIYELNLPEKYEQAVAESASLAANSLQERRQFDVAHQVLDEAYGHMRRNENRVALLKVNAFVFRSEGNLDKAMELLRRAIEMERQGTRP